MLKLNLKNKLKAPFKRWREDRDRDPLKFTPKPFRDWQRLVLVWLICLSGLFLGTAALIWQTNSLRLAEELTGTATTTAITPVLLNQTQQLVSERANNFSAASQTPPILIDPGR